MKKFVEPEISVLDIVSEAITGAGEGGKLDTESGDMNNWDD